MSGDEMIEGKEIGMEVEGKSSDRILNNSVVNEGKEKEKDPPFSRPPDQNPTENVELGVMEKDEITMEDAEELSKDETCDANATNSVDEMVLDYTDAAKSVETVPDNQQFVEVTVDIKGAGANGMCDNGQSQELRKNGDNDEMGVGETDIGAGVEEVALNDKSGSDDVLALDEKSLEANVEEGEKCVPLKDYPLGAKVEDVGKGGELKDKPLVAKVEDGTKKDDLSEKPLKAKAESGEQGPELTDVVNKMELSQHTGVKEEVKKLNLDAGREVVMNTPGKSFLLEPSSAEGYESGTEEEQAEFLKDVETFYRENSFEFKAPKFYKEELNLLKLWRAVIKLGGYEQVTSCKLWRQVGESFRPPKTCTTVSWTFRIFYEKALLEYEKHKMRNGELPFTDGTLPESIRDENQAGGSQAFGSGRARRDAAARAMQGWHSQRLLDNGQVCQPIIKDKTLSSTPKSDKQQKTNGLLKRKKPSTVERAVSVTPMKTMKQQGDTVVIDIGPPADWVKINVQKTNDCFEIYALVPGLLREEVHVQSDPAGRLIISGQPEQLDNPWGVTPFKKVVSLPSRIDPHQTSAVVTLHGQLFVRVPFEQPDH